MFNFQKYNKYKLYNLAEAFNLDSFDDEEDLQGQVNSKIKTANFIEEFINSHILVDNDNPLTTFEEMAIGQLNNDIEGKYLKIVQVQDRNQLEDILRRAANAKYLGMEGNFNWIDTSKIDSLTNLFPNVFGRNVNTFNGDISKWDVSNVTKMLYTFQGCQSLRCDITNWDVSNVRVWTSDTYRNTNNEFTKYCKVLEARIKKSPNYILKSLRK